MTENHSELSRAIAELMAYEATECTLQTRQRRELLSILTAVSMEVGPTPPIAVRLVRMIDEAATVERDLSMGQEVATADYDLSKLPAPEPGGPSEREPCEEEEAKS